MTRKIFVAVIVGKELKPEENALEVFSSKVKESRMERVRELGEGHRIRESSSDFIRRRVVYPRLVSIEVQGTLVLSSSSTCEIWVANALLSMLWRGRMLPFKCDIEVLISAAAFAGNCHIDHSNHLDDSKYSPQ